MATSPRLVIRLGIAALAVLGALGGMVPTLGLQLGDPPTPLFVLYCVTAFLTSGAVVAVALASGLHAPRSFRVASRITYSITMVVAGTLNGLVVSLLQGALIGEWEFLPVIGMVGMIAGGTLAVVYTIGFAPAMWGLRRVHQQPTHHDGLWVRGLVGLSWTGAGLIALALAVVFLDGLPRWRAIGPLAVASVGALLLGVSLFQGWRVVVLSSGNAVFKRVAAATLATGTEGLLPLHPLVRRDADHVLLRVSEEEDGPYRGVQSGEPYAWVN